MSAVRCYIFLQFYLLSLVLVNTSADFILYEGELCKMQNSLPGICRLLPDCTEIVDGIKSGTIKIEDPVHCSYWKNEEVICCPMSSSTESKDRPAVAACKQIEEATSLRLVPSILRGIPVSLGEYPYMAAVGYLSIGNDNDLKYDFRCGGALISSRFVLSAAHCFINPNLIPAIVRLGAVDLNNPEELENAVDVQIKKVHRHPNYNNSVKYDDIALLELNEEVKITQNISPACLYTDIADPSHNSNLYVTGWGTFDDSNKFSDVLLQAKLEIVPLERCNVSYSNYGFNRQLNRGVINTQICAADVGYEKDSCSGDSGGPLVDKNDEDSHRIVGVISTGFGCGSPVPGLYTRVSAYLAFIENIVWPELN